MHKKMSSSSKKRILIGFWLYIPIVFTASMLLSPSLFEIGFLFYVLPVIGLIWLMPGQAIKTSIAAFTFSLLWLALDLIWQTNKAWTIYSIFDTKIFGLVTLEDFLWSFFWFYFVIMFYEYFVESDSYHEKTLKKTKLALVALLLILPFVYMAEPFYENFIYSYLILGSLLILLPLIYAFLTRSKIVNKLSLIFVYFMCHSIALEIVALHFKHWEFEKISGYIGEIIFFDLSMAFEELFLFILAGAPALVILYEYFADDKK